MFKNFICLVFALSLLFAACHKKAMSASGASSSANKASSKTTSEIKNVIVDPKLDIMNIGGATVNVDSLAISGDILSVFVNYSGGCKEHSFDLYSNAMYAKSLPPKLKLFIKHSNNEDGCRELVNAELKFNIVATKSGKSLSIQVANKFIKYETK